MAVAGEGIVFHVGPVEAYSDGHPLPLVFRDMRYLHIIIEHGRQLTLIQKFNVEDERSRNELRRRWYEYRNVEECGEVGSGDIRSGRIRRPTTDGSTGKDCGGIGRKSFGLVAKKSAQLG